MEVYLLNYDDIKSRFLEHGTHFEKAFHVWEIGIYGSFVKNKQKAKSDIGILVEFEKGHKDFLIT